MRIALSVAALILLGACSTSPVQYTIKGEATPTLNRDRNGKSLSVVVRAYQLKDAQEFSKLTFDTLASGRPESDFLGSALLGKTDAVIIPGGTYENTDKLLPETRYVGIVAFFRKPDPYYWRLLTDADSVRRHGLSFKVQDCYIQFVEGNFIPLPEQPASYRPDCGAPASTMPQNGKERYGNTRPREKFRHDEIDTINNLYKRGLSR